MSKVTRYALEIKINFLRLTDTRKAFLGLRFHLKKKIRISVPHYCTLDDVTVIFKWKIF